jgi:hypothetical protein
LKGSFLGVMIEVFGKNNQDLFDVASQLTSSSFCLHVCSLWLPLIYAMPSLFNAPSPGFAVKYSYLFDEVEFTAGLSDYLAGRQEGHASVHISLAAFAGLSGRSRDCWDVATVTVPK